MTSTKKLTFASVCLLCCFALPMLTAGNEKVASMLCLMHAPVMVCGMMCGAPWGVAVGMTAPILRSLMLYSPAMYPDAVAMAFEMGVYGFVCGLETNDPRREPTKIYIDLILAMIAGRVMWCVVMCLFALISDVTVTLPLLKDSILNTWPGVALQLIALPPLIVFLQMAYYPDDIVAL